MSNRSKSPRSSFVRITSVTLLIGLVLALAINASAGTGLADSLASFFGFAAETTTASTTTAEPAAPAAPMFAGVTTNGGSGLAASYTTLADAITALNAATITSAVVITADGTTETAPAGGYSITATGTSTNTITITGAGTTITANGALTIGNINDAIFKIVGGDYITIEGFVMNENAANTTTGGASPTNVTTGNNMTEWGVALLYASTTNGAQNCTIQNNTITLNRTYQNTFGIYSNSTHSATAVTTSATATTAAGGNENLKVYGNTISNVNMGIVHVGPTAAADQNITADIGGTTAPTGNSITNYGTTTTNLSGYANVSGTINGILVRNTKSFNISRNTVNSSNGGVVVGTLNGIQVPAASNAPTGTLTQTINNNSISLRPGATGIAMNGINMPSTSVNATTTNNINNNDFNTFGHTVAGGTGAITFITQGGNPLNQTFNGNTFTNISVNTTGTITFFSFAPSMISTASLQLNSNSIVTGFTRTGVGSTTVWSSNASSVAGCTQSNSNNNFSNITLTGASAFTGISNTDGGRPTKTVNGNTFSNITTGAGTVTPMSVNFSATGSTVNNNTITGITTSNSITALLLGSSNDSITVSGNVIDPITSGGAAVTGISSAAVLATISKNKIYDLVGTATTSVVSGLILANTTASSAVTVSNNLIGNLTSSTATGSNAVIGLNITGSATTSNYNVYHNTIYVNNTTSAAGFGSSGISALASTTATTSTLNLRNNIVVNTSAPGTGGLTVAYRRSAGAAGNLANYGSTSNNNLFYAGTPGVSNLIYSDGTSTAQTMTAYKNGIFTAGTISPRDTASFTENPPFLSTTGSSSTFLHINPATPTQIESGGGSGTGVTDDFDGDARGGTPDVGADEGSFTVLDLTAPSISYTALGNTALVTNRSLPATITDPSGVAGAGNSPRIYFKKSTDGAYVSTQCSGSYSCTIDYSMVGGGSVTAGDIIQYFVVAQDTAGNVGASPSGGFAATDVNTVSSPPTTPSSYNIVTGFTGTKTLCSSGCDYASLTNTGGIFEAINAAVLTGNLTIDITGDLTAELGTVALNEWVEEGGSGYTMTIKPSGAARTISGSNTGALIRLNGADRVTIDGSTLGMSSSPVVGGNPAIRELTIQNTNTGTSAVVLSVGSGTNGAKDNTVKNTNILGQDPTTTAYGISLGGTTPGTPGTDNDNNRVENCSVKRAIRGIYSSGLSLANQNTGTVITLNHLAAVTTDRIRRVGIVVFNESGVQITLNSVGGIDNTGESLDVVGIGVGSQTPSNSDTTSGGVTGAMVLRNKVNGVSNDTTFSAVGIAVAGGAGTVNTLENNMVTGVISDATSPDNPSGIWVAGVTGSSTRLYHNSVAMTGDRSALLTPATSQHPSYALAVTGTGAAVELRNNIFYTTQTASVGSNPSAKSYAIGLVSITFAAFDSNYNLYWSAGAQDGGFRSNSLAASGGVDYVDVNAWETASCAEACDDGDSIEDDPDFVDPPTDPHITSASPAHNAGTTLGTVTDDFDGDSRPTGSASDIGADEITTPDTPTATNTNTPSSTATFTPSETSTETATATQTATQTATETATSTSTPTSTPTASSNLKITKTDNVDPVEELTPWKYTVRIENLGPDRTSGITMQDTIPIEILFLDLKSTLPIPVGEDMFWTPPGGTVSAWGASPIPPGFFNPGSDPFFGTVQLQGIPLGPGPYSPSGLCGAFPPLGAGPNGQHGAQGSPAGCGGPGVGATDTIVRRMAPSSLPMDGGSASVPIELVQLSLQSVMPITVTTGGGGSPEPWQVQVGLAPGPQPAGNMMLNRNANTNNGTMTINLPVNRRYTFVDVGTAGHPPVFIDRLEVFTGSGTFTQDTGSCSTPAPNTNGTISCSGYTIDSFFDIFFEIDVTSTANAGGTVQSNTATTSGTEFDPDLSNNSDTELTTITEPPTPTNTATETATATDTPTPSSTATETPTATETATATSSSTNTATPTPTAGSIAGTVTYGNSIGSPAPPRYVPNVLISGAGSPAVSDTTGAPGTYFLTGFGAGAYTVTPSKSGQTGSITSLDAARIAQYLTGAISFSSAQLTVADVSGAGGISSFDAALIARYAVALGAPTGSSGTWIFSPVNRTYPVVLDTDFTGEDYSALLMGEVSGNYDPAGLRPAFAAGPERSAAVAAPKLLTPADNEVIIPVSVVGAANKGIISYEFDLRYDPAVIQPQADPVVIAGTVSSGLMAVANAEGRGLLRVVVYGPTPIDANGVLLNLKFTAVGAPGSITPLTFERFMFNEGDPSVVVSDGQLELSAAASNQAEIGGRLLSSMGQGIPNARVTLTDTAGQSRSVRSNGFGVYRFGSLKVGQTYTISVEARNYSFTPMTVSVTGQSVAADMIAEQ